MTPQGALARSWLDAAGRPHVARALQEIYSDTAAAVAARGPACWASARCCDFERSGHRLYVTGLEAAYTVANLARPAPIATGGPRTLPQLGSPPAPPPLTADSLGRATAAGSCPFLVRNLCAAHGVKPLGCRVYFCDRSAESWQHDLTETMLRRLRALHDEHEIEYRYAEWRALLRLFAAP